MSMRIMWSSLSNKKPAKALHNSVFPTPVGPRNKKEPVGRFGSPKPARERRIAFDTAVIASSWPTTRWCNLSSICSNLSRSPCMSLETGMPVARATTSAISSAPTCVRNNRCTPSLDSLLLSLAFASLRRFSNSGNLPYCNSATLLKSPLRVSSSIWKRMRSISSLTCAPPWAEAFSDFQMSSKSEYSLPTLMISSSSNSMRLIDASSFSLRTASRSILS